MNPSRTEPVGARPSATTLIREVHARGCHCMPVRDDDGNLVFTSRDDRCESFVVELRNAAAVELAELRAAVKLVPAIERAIEMLFPGRGYSFKDIRDLLLDAVHAYYDEARAARALKETP